MGGPPGVLPSSGARCRRPCGDGRPTSVLASDADDLGDLVHRRLATIVGLGVTVAVTAGCGTTVHGLASHAGGTSAASSRAAPTPGDATADGADPACLIEDGCPHPGAPASPRDPGTTDTVVCAPLPTAMVVFDEQAGALFASGRIPNTSSDARLGALRELVVDVVDQCGYQVMVDVANQYPDPLYGWLRTAAVMALGDISALRGGLRCADLASLGFGPKQAVDYWFLWNGPSLMDADVDGIPCETVWANVQQYMPAHY